MIHLFRDRSILCYSPLPLRGAGNRRLTERCDQQTNSSSSLLSEKKTPLRGASRLPSPQGEGKSAGGADISPRNAHLLPSRGGKKRNLREMNLRGASPSPYGDPDRFFAFIYPKNDAPRLAVILSLSDPIRQKKDVPKDVLFCCA